MTIIRIVSGFVGYVSATTVAIRSFQLSNDTLPEEVKVLLTTSGCIFALLAGLLLYTVIDAMFDLNDRA
jgi:putative Ca2+/H+ antiporter (TMEM165/GDT1 family)